MASVTSMHTPESRERAYNKIKNIRSNFLNENGPCVKCGSWDGLEIDHIDPAEKISHNVWSWAKERRLAELAKCQILCHTCHLKKTADDRASKVTHGTRAMYIKRGCRCDACKEAWALYRYSFRHNFPGL